MEKIQLVCYDEIGEGTFILHALGPNINGDEYVRKLNNRIDAYNNDVEYYYAKKSEIEKLHNLYASFFEITGEERLNECEPKYPAQMPSGVKDIKVAFPEITLERNRRKEINEKNNKIYYAYLEKANEAVRLTIEPYKNDLISKWPEFSSFIKGYSVDKIYNPFFILEKKIVTNNL